jgi:hypothetical protein
MGRLRLSAVVHLKQSLNQDIAEAVELLGAGKFRLPTRPGRSFADDSRRSSCGSPTGLIAYAFKVLATSC